MRSILVSMLLVALGGAPSATPEWAVAVFPSGARFNLEIAATPESRAKGYMFRERIPANEGMLFLFERPERHGIWMKNCETSLDIIWLDADLRVLEIFADAQPCPAGGRCPSMQPMQLADYVLEVAGGRAAEESLQPGDTLLIQSEPPLR